MDTPIAETYFLSEPDTPPCPHAPRHRLRKEDGKALAFYAGWTLRQAAARDRSYLPVTWQDVVAIARAADRGLALR
jgi:hypothetical protein